MRKAPTELRDILLVEDSAGDIMLTKVAFSRAAINDRLHVVRDGEEAICFLRRQGGFSSATRPDLILLDINLPNMDGWEVLAEIKEDPDLRQIPVVVLSTSAEQKDIRQSYGLHANGYVTKPATLTDFLKVVSAIAGFWFTAAQLPGPPRSLP